MDAPLSFQWDPRKAAENARKHRVTFHEAASTFRDEFAAEHDDPDHSENEDRYILLGLSRALRVLVVSYCYRDDDVIRIISARKADNYEAADYFRRMI